MTQEDIQAHELSKKWMFDEARLRARNALVDIWTDMTGQEFPDGTYFPLVDYLAAVGNDLRDDPVLRPVTA